MNIKSNGILTRTKIETLNNIYTKGKEITRKKIIQKW